MVSKAAKVVRQDEAWEAAIGLKAARWSLVAFTRGVGADTVDRNVSERWEAKTEHVDSVSQRFAHKGNLGQVSNLTGNEGHGTGIWDWGDFKLFQNYCILNFFACSKAKAKGPCGSQILQ